MTTTSIRTGYKGSIANLRSGDFTSDAELSRWVGLAVDTVQAALPGSAVWVPNTSEIIYDLGDTAAEEFATGDVDGWLGEQLAAAWQVFCK